MNPLSHSARPSRASRVSRTLIALASLGVSALAASHALAQTQTIAITPSADATIYSASNGIDEAANGGGSQLFSGWTTRFGERRALLKFDLAGLIPPQATITSAQLTINVNRSIAEGNEFNLHRVTAPWNEGPSIAEGPEGNGAEPLNGDVTWTFRQYNIAPALRVPWSTPGGEFAPLASISSNISFASTYTFGPSAQLATDVTGWLTNPASNNGWIIIADNPFFSGSAKRFASRSNAASQERPTLTITYTTCNDVDFNNDEIFPDDRDVIDFFDVLAGGACAACDSIDFNGDGVFPDDRDVTTFFNVLAGGPCE